MDFAIDEEEGLLNVELNLPTGSLMSSIGINDLPWEEQELEPEVKIKIVPFPVVMPGDKELVCPNRPIHQWNAQPAYRNAIRDMASVCEVG